MYPAPPMTRTTIIILPSAAFEMTPCDPPGGRRVKHRRPRRHPPPLHVCRSKLKKQSIIVHRTECLEPHIAPTTRPPLGLLGYAFPCGRFSWKSYRHPILAQNSHKGRSILEVFPRSSLRRCSKGLLIVIAARAW